MSCSAVLKLRPIQNLEALPFGQVCRQFITDWSSGASELTRKHRAAALKQLTEWLTERCGQEPAIGDVPSDMLQAYLDSRKSRGAKPATVASDMNSIKALYGAISKLYPEVQDPTDRLTRVKFEPPRPTFWTVTEVDSLRGYLYQKNDGSFKGERDVMLFELLLQTGLRLHEALSLNADQLDPPHEHLEDVQRKGNYFDRIYLRQTLRKHLDRYLKRRREELVSKLCSPQVPRDKFPLLLSFWQFKAEDPETLRLSDASARRIIRDACEHCFIPEEKRHPHVARHTFGKLVCDTYDIREAAQALGHRSLTHTMRYAMLSEEELEKKLDKVKL